MTGCNFLPRLVWWRRLSETFSCHRRGFPSLLCWLIVFVFLVVGCNEIPSNGTPDGIGGVTRPDSVSSATAAPASALQPGSLPPPTTMPKEDKGALLLPSRQVVALTHDAHRWTPTAEELGQTQPSNSVQVDETRLSSYLENIARQLNRSATDATLNIKEDFSVESVTAKSGLQVDVVATAASVRQTLTSPAATRPISSAGTPERPVEVAVIVRTVPSAVTESDLAEAKASLEQALSSRITLRLGERMWYLEKRDIAPALTVVKRAGPSEKPGVKIDDAIFRKPLEKLSPQVAQEATSARFAWNNGNMTVLRESAQGQKLEVDQSVARLKDRLFTAKKVVDLVVAPVNPAVETVQKDRLGIKALVGSARTSFAGGIPEKQANIKLAASRLNGVVVPPGATFSFNKEVGPTTLDSGFQWGYGIVSGSDGLKTVPSVAGGICQVSTTLFQAVFWSGYQIEERSWHLYWIPSYTSRGIVGLDSTVDEASGLDLKFTNTTSDYLLIQSGVDGGNVWFSLYGTKPSWVVEVAKPIIKNTTPPNTELVTEEDPTMAYGKRVQVEAARDGFAVEVVRRVHEGGHTGDDEAGPGALRTLRLRSTYQPSRNVVVVGAKGKPAGAPLVQPTATPKPRVQARPSTTAPKLTPIASPTPAPNVTKTPEPAGTPVLPTPRPSPSPTAKPAGATPTR